LQHVILQNVDKILERRMLTKLYWFWSRN